MDELDLEIIEWVAFAKGDFLGHIFHGNQHTMGEGGATATMPRRVDPGRYQSSGRFGESLGSKAVHVAQNPTPLGHRTLASAHQAAANALREEASKASGEKATLLGHAADSHERAAEAHENAASNYGNRITSGIEGYNQDASTDAAEASQTASERTTDALNA